MTDNEELAQAGFEIAKALDRLGLNGAATNMGAIESHSVVLKESAEIIANAIDNLAEAIREHRTNA
jgi:hypothetical protein